MPYTAHQPDKGGHKASAKATIPLPFANPQADEPKAEPSKSTPTTSPPNRSDNGHKDTLQSITPAPPNPYAAARAALDKDGFVILPASLFPSFDLAALRSAAARITAAARTGKWPYIRTLPKQFPPWNEDASNGIWGVQHLLHPENPDHMVFARSYFDAELLKYVGALVGGGGGCSEEGEEEEGGEEDLTMELYNLLVRPERDFSLRWHRDDIPSTTSPADEAARLAQPAGHAQWNLALYEDASLVLVPGSHVRARTEAERSADAYAPRLEGQVTVRLRAGEVAFYNNNILHRGVYDCTKERMTLHGSIGTRGAGRQRARNVLQHGVGEWVGKWDLSGEEGEWVERARGMRERLVELGRESGDVGYFAEGE